MNAPLNIEQLLQQYWAAKTNVDRAAEELALVQSAIVSLMPKKEEGTTTGDFGDSKVTVTYKLTRKVDTSGLTAAWTTMPLDAQKCFSWKAEVATKEMRAAESMNAEAYAAALQHITSSPAKPALKIERK
jgi:hypothetical protein